MEEQKRLAEELVEAKQRTVSRSEAKVKAETILEKVKSIYGELLEPREPVRNPEEMVRRLRQDYRLLVDRELVYLVVAAFLNGRPVLFEGPPGTGKTEVGEAILSLWSGKNAFVLPCSENYDEYRVIGDFHPLMAMKYGFNEESFIPRPLLAAILLDAGVLVDEIRRSSEEFQNMLLDIVDKRRIIVPELRRVFRAKGLGFQVIFTSNPEDIAQNELSDAFLRRVVRVKFTYPSPEREAEIVRMRLSSTPRLPDHLLSTMIECVNELRSTATHKPGPADTVLWAQLAAKMAELRGSSTVSLDDVVSAARVVLFKRDEDADTVEEVVEKFFGK